MNHYARDYYNAGLEVIPLPAGEKHPPPTGYSKIPMSDLPALFSEYPRYSNVGVRAGDDSKLVVIDCDGPGMLDQVGLHLRDNGLPEGNYPVTRSVSADDRGHILLKVDDKEVLRQYTGNLHKKHFANPSDGHIGFGPGAYIALPPSHFNQTGKSYTWDVEARGSIPFVQPGVILELLPQRSENIGRQHASMLSDGHPDDKLAVQVLRREPSQFVYESMTWLQTAAKGMGYQGYGSRSELEFSVIMSLILAGWQFGEVLSYFRKIQPGHFVEQRNPEAYLKQSWYRAMDYIEQTQPRPEIAETLDILAASNFGKYSQKPVALAMLRQAYLVGKFQLAIAQRDLMVLTGINSRRTIQRAASELVEQGMINRVIAGDTRQTTVYNLSGLRELAESVSGVYHKTQEGNRENVSYGAQLRQETETSIDKSYECIPPPIAQQEDLSPEIEAAFWKLHSNGQSMREVYYVLVNSSHTLPVADIVDRAGISRATVYRAFKNLQKLDLVTPWIGGYEVSCIKISELPDIEIAKERLAEQRQTIKHQRNKHRKWLRHIA